MSCHSSPQNGLATLVDRITLPLRSPPITGVSSLLRAARPSPWHRYSSSWCLPLVISLLIQSEVLTFHTEACTEVMPPIHRLPPGP
jgi:hypothetical protein